MIQFFISAIAKQTHNKKWNTLLEFAWSVQFSIPKMKRKEKKMKQTRQKSKNKRKMRSEEERATVISGSSYWIRKPNWRTGVWFVALFVVCMTPICQHKLIRELRKNRDYLRIIPFYFILFSTISVSLCISSDDFVYSVVACVFFSLFCAFFCINEYNHFMFTVLLFALILIYTYLYAVRLFARRNENFVWMSTTDSEMSTCK